MKKQQPLSMPGILATLLLLGVIALDACSNQATPSPYPTSLGFSEDVNKAFISGIAAGVNLNSGITIERALPLTSSKTDMRSVTFAVFNHTDEPVTFPDQGFGLLVFHYDSIGKKWEKVPLGHFPERTPKTLPSKTEKWDLKIQNIWDVLENDLDPLPYRKLRFYVLGSGDSTGIKYGAYLDVTNSP